MAPRKPILTGTVSRVAGSLDCLVRVYGLDSTGGVDHKAEEALRLLSDDGWEIKAVVSDGSRHIFYFQRFNGRPRADKP